MKSESATSLRVALIGVGQIVRNYHVPALLGLGHRIVFASDPSQKALAILSSLLPETPICSASDKLEIPVDADVALVASPTALHAPQVRWLLQNGYSVFCEKPLACNLDEAVALADLALLKGLILQVGYFRRHLPSLILLGSWLRSGLYGKPLRIAFRLGHIAKGIPSSFLNIRLSGGGVLMDLGVHAFDMLANWCDEVRLESYADDAEANGVEANAFVQLSVCIENNQVPATIELSRTSPLGFSVLIEFEKLTVTADINDGHEINFAATGSVGPLKLSVGEPREIVYYIAEEWLEFAARWNGKPEKAQCLKHAVLATDLAECCYKRRKFLSLPWGY